MGFETLAAPIIGAVASTLFSSMFSKKQEAPPAAPAVEAAKPPPQASTAPDVNAVRQQVAGATGPGEASTLLTGIGGVDPAKLNLGKATLLGE